MQYICTRDRGSLIGEEVVDNLLPSLLLAVCRLDFLYELHKPLNAQRNTQDEQRDTVPCP